MWKIVTKHQISVYNAKLEEQQNLRIEQQKLEAIQNQNAEMKKLVVESKLQIEELERQVSTGQQAQQQRLAHLEQQVSGQDATRI